MKIVFGPTVYDLIHDKIIKCKKANRYLDSKLRSILGTGRNWLEVTACRSTGQVGCRLIHSVIQARQNACSQAGA